MITENEVVEDGVFCSAIGAERSRLSDTRHAELLLPSLAALLYLSLCLFFLLTAPIGSSSEAREAHVIQEIVRSGNFFLPHRNNLLPSKPPLFHWIAALSSRLLSISPVAAARLLSAFSGALLLLLTMRQFLKLAPSLGPLGAICSGFILVTNYEFVRLSLDCRVDMLFCVFVFLSIVPFLNPETGCFARLERDRYDALFFFAALAVLTKGPLGIVLPILIVYSLRAARLGVKAAARQLFKPVRGWLVFAALAAPWYVFAALSSKGGIVDRQIIFENLSRFVGGEFVNNRAPWYYIVEGCRASFPWFPLFLLTLPFVVRTWKTSDRTYGDCRMLLFPLLTAIGFFSLASGKRYSYLAPLFPLMSIYVAAVLVHLYRALPDRKAARYGNLARKSPSAVIFLAWTIILLLGAITLDWSVASALADFGTRVLRDNVFGVTSILAMSSLLTWVVCRFAAGRLLPAVLAAWLTFEFCLFTLIFLPLSVRNSFCNFQGMAARINTLVPSSQPLAAVRDLRDEYLDTVLYYLNRRVSIVAPGAAMQLGCGERVLAKRVLFDDLSRRGKPLVIDATMSQIPDAVRGANERDVILFRVDC